MVAELGESCPGQVGQNRLEHVVPVDHALVAPVVAPAPRGWRQVQRTGRSSTHRQHRGQCARVVRHPVCPAAASAAHHRVSSRPGRPAERTESRSSPAVTIRWHQANRRRRRSASSDPPPDGFDERPDRAHRAILRTGDGSRSAARRSDRSPHLLTVIWATCLGRMARCGIAHTPHVILVPSRPSAPGPAEGSGAGQVQGWARRRSQDRWWEHAGIRGVLSSMRGVAHELGVRLVH